MPRRNLRAGLQFKIYQTSLSAHNHPIKLFLILAPNLMRLPQIHRVYCRRFGRKVTISGTIIKIRMQTI